MTQCDVAVIGAGPYGLSIAAHLKARGVDFRIFGKPMDTWLTHMPKGMRLKSEGFASWLYDPGSTFTLETYCNLHGIPYGKIGRPVPLDVFSAYGLEFQKKFLPELKKELVTSVKPASGGFEVTAADGEKILARRIVMAIGLTHYKFLPPELASVPEEFLSHSSKHATVDQFKGRDVIVIGAGASALDLTALLHQAGARAQVVARTSKIRFHDPPDNLNPSFFDQLRTPITGIGPGWKLFLCSNMPLVFRLMPQSFRLDRVKRILGPAPCWFIKEEVWGKVPLNEGMSIKNVKVEDGRIRLQLVDATGKEKSLEADHVIAATGYKVNLGRLTFLDSGLLSRIRSVENTPVLSSNFESSVPGVYFVGASAANTFGPLLRFAFGAGFTAKRLSRHLASTAARPVVSKSQPAEKSLDRDEVAVG
jgi:thioredoxin reductase